MAVPPRRPRLVRPAVSILSASGGLVITTLALVLFRAPVDAQCAPELGGSAGYWVSSFGSDEVLRFAQDGEILGSFSHPQLDGPRSITVTPTGEVYVASQFTDAILVFDADGFFQRQFTSPELDAPTGAAIGPTGDYFVCSFGNDLVVRFDAAESLVASYSSPGLNGPNCIVFYPDGSFVVTGQISNDYHRFDADGNPLEVIATGQSSVMGAALDLSGRLLIAGGASNDIHLYDCDGALLESWPLAGGPQSIAVREDGLIYVTTFFTDAIIALTPGGTTVSTWVNGNTLRGIEFFPDAPPAFVRGDGNGDGSVDVADGVATLGYLFGLPGSLTLSCPDAADSNDDGLLDLSDPISLLGFLFQAGAPPAPPFPIADVDPTADSLGCLD